MRVYRISDAAARVGLHPQTLRDYERAGLIHFDRDSTGQRVLFEEDIREVQELVARRRLGQD